MFPVLLLALAYAVMLLWVGYTTDMSTGEGLAFAIDTLPRAAPVTFGIAGAWFAVAFLGHQAMIDMATKSKSVPRRRNRVLINCLRICVFRAVL